MSDVRKEETCDNIVAVSIYKPGSRDVQSQASMV